MQENRKKKFFSFSIARKSFAFIAFFAPLAIPSENCFLLISDPEEKREEKRGDKIGKERKRSGVGTEAKTLAANLKFSVLVCK